MHSIIYITGLGDAQATGQRLAIKTWRLWGVRPVMFQVNWADGEPFAPKFERLLKLIDDAALKGKVSLVGASAGATAVVNAFAVRSSVLHGAVCIAGKINNPGAISRSYKQANPAFAESAAATALSLVKIRLEDRRRILSIRAMLDLIVSARDSNLVGAQNRVSWTSGHVFTIAWQITVGAPSFIRWLKQIDK